MSPWSHIYQEVDQGIKLSSWRENSVEATLWGTVAPGVKFDSCVLDFYFVLCFSSTAPLLCPDGFHLFFLVYKPVY